MKLLIIVLFVIFTKSIYSQDKEYIPPKYSELVKFIQTNIKFSKKENADFDLVLSINKKGKVTIKNLIGDGDYFKEEIKNVINMMPDWQPATINGRSIDTTYSIKILFTIQTPRSFFEPDVIEIIEYKVPIGDSFYFPGQKEFNNGLDELNAKNYQQALEYFNIAASKKLYNIDIFNGRAIAYIHLGKLDSACINIQHGYYFYPDKFEKLLKERCSCAAINNVGYKNMNENKFDKANEMFSLALKYYPNDTSALYYRAINSLKLNKQIEAIEDLTEAILQGSVNADILIKANFNQQKLAGLYYQLVKKYSNEKDYNKSILYLDKIIVLYPGISQGYLTKADICFDSGRKTDACTNIKKAIELGAEVDQEKLRKYCD